MYLPMCLMSVVGGSARFNEKQRKLFFEHYFPWAIRAGMQSTDLMCVYYERHFHEDLEDVRRKWGITPAPAAPKWTWSPALQHSIPGTARLKSKATDAFARASQGGEDIVLLFLFFLETIYTLYIKQMNFLYMLFYYEFFFNMDL